MKRLFKILLWLVGIALICLIGTVIFSPYEKHGDNGYKSVEFTIQIDVPVDSVFNYLGNSDNAQNWSSFVDHITALNPDTHEDGTVGAIRRCFKEKDETGIIWDEEIIIVEPNQRRKLTVYDLQGFSMTAENLVTEQLYHPIGDHSMELTFSVFFKDEPGIIDAIKMNIASYEIHSIFKANLENVKRICETGK